MRGKLYAFLLMVAICFGTLYAGAQPTFTDVANARGLNLAGPKDGGFAWADFNEDGFLDVLVNTNTAGIRSRLYFSNGAATFTDVTATHAAGLTSGWTTERQVTYGDIDNDGDLDFAINTSGTSGGTGIKIFLNKGPGATPPYSFGTATQQPNQTITTIPGGMNSEGMAFVDYNNDGFLDLIIENHNYGIDIFRNDGTGTLIYVNNGITGFPTSASSGDYASATDFDNDGYVDYIARKEDALDFHRNLGNGTFVTVPGFNEQANNGNKGGVMMCDFDNDTDFDLFWTSNGTNQIWRQTGVGSGNFVATNEPANSAGVTIGNGIDGCTCGDMDNDGDIDLFLTDNNGPSFLFVNRTPNGSTSTFDFFQPDRGVDAGQPYNVNYGINVGADGEGVSFVDYDNDGDLDLYVNVNGGQNQLWENNLDNNNFMAVCLERTLSDTIRQVALGANALIKNCNDSIISGIREVNSANGHGTQLPHFVHFGIPNPGVEVIVEVYFPWRNGERDTLRYSVQPDTVTGECLTLLEEFSNEKPVPQDDTFWVCFQTTDTVNVQLNDVDPNGDSLATTTIIGPFHGSATVLVDQSIQYVPDPGYLGPDSIIYVVCDTGIGFNPCQIDYPKCDSAIVRISVIEQSNATDPGNPPNPLFDDVVDVSITLNTDTSICLPLEQGFFDDTLIALNGPAFPGATLLIEEDTCVRYISPATGPTPFRDTILFTLCNQCGCDTLEFRFNYQPEDCYDGIDNDGDGLVDCEDGDCPGTYPLLNVQIDTHYVQSIQEDVGVDLEFNAIGTPNGNGAEVYENSDFLGLDFQDTIPAGTTMYLRWGKRPGAGGVATPDIWQSIDYSGFTPIPAPPSYALGSPVFTVSNFTTTIDTRYFRISKGSISAVDFQIDALWWIEIDSSILCLPNMFAEDDFDTTYFLSPDTVNAASNDSAYLDPALWNYSTIVSPQHGTVSNTGGVFVYQPDSSLVLGGQDSFVYAFCDTSTPGLCDTATVYYFIYGLEICDDGIDNDGDGLADCYDSECIQFVPDTIVDSASGFADVVTVDNGVGDEFEALGAPDGDPAEIYDGSDILVLDLTDTVPAGQFYTIVWAKRSGQAGTAEMDVEESTNGVSFGPISTYTTIIDDPDFVATTVQASIDTRYLRFTKDFFVDYVVDAVFYTIYDSAFVCVNSLVAVLDRDTLANGDTALTNVAINDTLRIPGIFSLVSNGSNGTGTLTPGGLLTYVADSGFTGNDTLVYSLCDSTGAFCDTALVIYAISGPEICGNGIDDDFDGLIDQFDPDCYPNPPACTYTPVERDSAAFTPSLRCSYTNKPPSPYCTPMVGDLDNDSLPEIVYVSNASNELVIVNGNCNLEGSVSLPGGVDPTHGAVAIGDVDSNGFVDIFVAEDNGVIRRVQYNGATYVTVWTTAPGIATSNRKHVDIVDLNRDGNPEIIPNGGRMVNSRTGAVYPGILPAVQGQGKGVYTWTADADLGNNGNEGDVELIHGVDFYRYDFVALQWNLIRSVGAPYNASKWTFFNKTGIADMDLDGDVDAVVVAHGEPNGEILIWDLQTSTVMAHWDYPEADGSVPTIGNFDDDPEPELGFSVSFRVYVLDDIVNNAFPTILWDLATSDGSGHTGMTLFDFENDGEVELCYRDEDKLRVFRGRGDGAGNASVLFNTGPGSCTSNTGLEYPVIADVTGNGAANLVVTCDGRMSVYQSGGFPWADARPWWNTTAYNITTIDDQGRIPHVFQENYRVFNNFLAQNPPLSQLPGFNPPAADLEVQIRSDYGFNGYLPSACPELQVIIEICNQGSTSTDSFLIYNTVFLNDPYQASPTPVELLVDSLIVDLDSGECLIDTLIIPNSTDTNYTILINHKQDGAPLPLPPDTTYSLLPECIYSNNLSVTGSICIFAQDDIDTSMDGAPTSLNVLENDVFDSAFYGPPILTLLDSPQIGSINFNTSTGVVTYTPDTLAFGIDSFRYMLCDTSTPGFCDTAWVYIYVIREICNDGIDNNGNGLVDCDDVAACVPTTDSINQIGTGVCVNDTIGYSVNADPVVGLYRWSVSFESIIIESNFFTYAGISNIINVILGSPVVEICLVKEHVEGCLSTPVCDTVIVKDVPPPAPVIRR